MQVNENILLVHKLKFICFSSVALANSSDIPKQIFLCIVANDKKVKELIFL